VTHGHDFQTEQNGRRGGRLPYDYGRPVHVNNVNISLRACNAMTTYAFQGYRVSVVSFLRDRTSTVTFATTARSGRLHRLLSDPILFVTCSAHWHFDISIVDPTIITARVWTDDPSPPTTRALLHGRVHRARRERTGRSTKTVADQQNNGRGHIVRLCRGRVPESDPLLRSNTRAACSVFYFASKITWISVFEHITYVRNVSRRAVMRDVICTVKTRVIRRKNIRVGFFTFSPFQSCEKFIRSTTALVFWRLLRKSNKSFVKRWFNDMYIL